MIGTERADIKVGMKVAVILKKDQKSLKSSQLPQ
jgi:uncharacterized protein YwbE